MLRKFQRTWKISYHCFS